MADLDYVNGEWVTKDVAMKMRGVKPINSIEEFNASMGVKVEVPEKVVVEGIAKNPEVIEEVLPTETSTEVSTIEVKEDKLFEDMTDDELRALAKVEKIRGFGIMKRKTLINKLS